MHNSIIRLSALALAVGAAAACANFDVTNPNQPTLDDLLANPTRGKLSAAATGLFSRSRSEIASFIWRVGSMGREGINLAGNNQPDYQEPYFGPLSPSGFGGALWQSRFALIRDANTYIEALGKTGDLSAGEKAVSQAMAETQKALAFMYIIETRAKLGAPVDVGRAVDAPPAPFVSEDSVYAYAIGLLTDAYAKLQANSGVSFPFPLPPGYSGFDQPATFATYVKALTAKANVLRATAGCGTACYTAALNALSGSFIDTSDPTNLQEGVYFNFSNSPNDQSNDLSEPLNGVRYFADSAILYQKAEKNGNTTDLRLTNKTALATADAPQSIANVSITGTLKFTRYFTGGQPDPTHAIPIIKNEELILLRAEAEYETGNPGAALTDLNFVRVNSGGLQPLTSFAGNAAFVSALLYEREFSLLWEQGTTWIDARRFNLLNTIPVGVTPGGNVPTVMPVPAAECSARNLPGNCTPLGT
jgi:starch-binding outer membrane protein, SusD/RagB family